MPTYTNTAKYLLRKLAGSNLISDIDAGIAALADDVDSKMVGYSEGPAGSRPTSTVPSPGIAGRLYYATDEKVVYRDLGTGWKALDADSGYAEVLTSQSTSSGVVTDLATVGPSVSLAVPAGGVIAVHCRARISPASAAGIAMIKLDLSGTDLGVVGQAQATAGGQVFDVYSSPGDVPLTTPSNIRNPVTSGWNLITGPTRNTRFTAGTYTLKMRYQTTSAMSSAFADRMLWARVLAF